MDVWRKAAASLGGTTANVNFFSANGKNPSKAAPSMSTNKLTCFLFFFSSLTGLHSLLSVLLFVFTQDPYSCVPLFSNSSSECVFTLSRLLSPGWSVLGRFHQPRRLLTFRAAELTAACFLLHSLPWRVEDAPGRSEVELSRSSLSSLSCHLLCFPFALDLPSHTASAVLQAYDSCGVASSLLQVEAFSCFTAKHQKSDATQNNSCPDHMWMFVLLGEDCCVCCWDT